MFEPAGRAAQIVSLIRATVPDVIAVYGFGSMARGQATADSDVDLAVLAPALMPERRLRGKRPASLDEWLEALGIDEVDRHDALGDAYATAQLLLPLLHAARARGLTRPAALAAESAAAARLRELSR